MAGAQKNLLWIECDGSNEKHTHRLRSAMKQHVMLDFLDKKAQSNKSSVGRKSPQHDANRAKRALLQRLICPEPTPALVCYEDQLVFRAAWWHNYAHYDSRLKSSNDVPKWQLQCKRDWHAGLWEVARLDETFLETFLSLAAAKEAAVKHLANAPAYYRHKGKALKLLTEDINDEGPALRMEAIATIAVICHMHFFESDYEGAERHCEALVRLMEDRLHQLPSILWQFIAAADLHLAAVSVRKPRLPYHLHRDFRSLYFYNPSEKIVNITSSNFKVFPVGVVFSTEQSQRTKRLLRGLHGLAHAQGRHDLDRSDVWAHNYDLQFLLAQLQVEVEEHGSIEERIILIGCQMQKWGMMANLVAQPDIQRFQLRRLEQVICTVDPSTLCDRWMEVTGSLDLLLWALCNAGVCVLQFSGSRYIATEPLPSWLQPYLEYIFERLSLERDEDLSAILQTMPFTERWNGRACRSFAVWSTRDVTSPSSSSSRGSSSPPPHTLFVRLRQDFDDWIDV